MKKLVIGILVIAATLTGICFIFCGKAKAVQENKKLFSVKTMILTPKSIASSISVMGTVDSLTRTTVIATAEGTIRDLRVREGSYVSEGQVICYIMPVDSQNMLSQARIEYNRAKAALDKSDDASKAEAETVFKEAELMLKSASTLYKPVPAVSPVSGTVLSKSVDTGSYVIMKQNLVEVADLKKLIVRSAVSEETVIKIHTGESVKIHLQTESGNVLTGKINAINPGISFQSRTAGVEIGIPYSKNLKPGMTCTVEFITEWREGAIVAPVESVLLDYSGNKVVYIIKEDKAINTVIKTGIESNNGIEILSGASFGDELVVMGQDNLKNGVSIKKMEKKSDLKNPGQEKTAE